MIRRVLAMLIALVGTAGAVVVGLATYFPEEDQATITPTELVRGLEVDVEVGRVIVVAGATEATTVTRTRRHLRGTPVTDERVVQGVLQISAGCRRWVTFGCEVDYRIEVPGTVSVRVRVDDGAVSVEGIGGMVEVETKAGAVDLIRTQGPAKVTTSAGNVEGEDLNAEFLDATTGAGRIRLSMARPPGRLGLRTGAGSIDVGLPPADGGYRVAAEAESGTVDVSVSQNAGGNRAVIANSGAGRISIHSR
jgi:hypothetical protein